MDAFQESDLGSCVSPDLLPSTIRLYLCGLPPPSNIWPHELRRPPGDRSVRNTVLKVVRFYRFKERDQRNSRNHGPPPEEWLRQADYAMDTADYFPDAEMLLGRGHVRCF